MTDIIRHDWLFRAWKHGTKGLKILWNYVLQRKSFQNISKWTMQILQKHYLLRKSCKTTCTVQNSKIV